MQSKKQDYIYMFIKVLSELTEDQKRIIRKLGFGSILNFTCLSNINDIFQCLERQLDTTSATVFLENGFSYTLSAPFVFKVFGIPFGTKSIEIKHPRSVLTKSMKLFRQILLLLSIFALS
jgi:hypothetical protein